MSDIETLAREQALSYWLADRATQEALQRAIDDGWAEMPKPTPKSFYGQQAN
jgi:hypothetical protein